MLIKANVCRDPTEWPRDTQKQVFLQRVIYQVGKIIFGSEWTGQEPDCEIIVETEDEAAAFRLWQEFDTVLKNHHEQIGQSFLHWQSLLGEIVEAENFEGLINIGNGFDEQVDSTKARYKKAAETVVDACCNEKLTTCLRPLKDGDYSGPLCVAMWLRWFALLLF